MPIKVAQITARSVFDVGFVKASIKSTTKYIFTGVSYIFTDSVCRIYLTLLMSSLKIAWTRIILKSFILQLCIVSSVYK